MGKNRKGLINRNRVFALIFLMLLLVLLIFLLWWWFGGVAPVEPVVVPRTIDDTVVLPSRQPTEIVPSPIPEVPVISDGELQIMTLARNFAERYGSWSTDTDFQNLRDLFPNITNTLQRRFESTIASAATPQEYKGFQTKALNVRVTSLEATTAEATVVTQRAETLSDLSQNIKYENLDVSMVKIGDFWYVDNATWIQ